LTKRLRVSVPVGTTQGEPKGVKTQGGLLEIITRAAEIECLPDEIPEHFTVDVTELLMGQSKRFSDLPMSGSMKLLGSPETVIAHIVAMRAEEVKPAAEAAPTAEAAATPAPNRKSSRRARRKKRPKRPRPKKK
jgi:large subunit ribosomal protein L25